MVVVAPYPASTHPPARNVLIALNVPFSAINIISGSQVTMRN